MGTNCPFMNSSSPAVSSAWSEEDATICAPGNWLPRMVTVSSSSRPASISAQCEATPKIAERRWCTSKRAASFACVSKLHWLLACAAIASSAAEAGGSIVYAGSAWAAIDRGTSCEALSRSLRIAAKGKVQAIAGFTFSPDRHRWGELHVRLRRMPRAGAAVMLRIDNRPFLLVSRGNEAWSDGPVQEQAIIAALRASTGMSVESRDASGGRFIDPYSLDGAATAIDAAAAACAGKMQSR